MLKAISAPPSSQCINDIEEAVKTTRFLDNIKLRLSLKQRSRHEPQVTLWAIVMKPPQYVQARLPAFQIVITENHIDCDRLAMRPRGLAVSGPQHAAAVSLEQSGNRVGQDDLIFDDQHRQIGWIHKGTLPTNQTTEDYRIPLIIVA
jgi:hypothetical protein